MRRPPIVPGTGTGTGTTRGEMRAIESFVFFVVTAEGGERVA